MTNKTLTQKYLNSIQKIGVKVKINNYSLVIKADLKIASFHKLKPYLYNILNNLEQRYFIIIQGIPYCLMSDARDHLVYKTTPHNKAVKVKECLKCLYEDACPGWPQGINQVNKNISASAIANLPREIILELTQKCNQACLLCFSQKFHKEITFNKIKSLLDEAARLKIKTVRFTGGEPLLYKNIGKVLTYAKNKGFYIILNTNGTILDRKIENILKNNVDNILISLQGFSPASDKMLTQSTLSFAQKLKNIARLNRIIPTVRVGTIISKTLMKNFKKYEYMIEKLKIKNWELYRPMSEKSPEFDIERKDIIKIMLRLKALKNKGLDAKIANPLPFCISNDYALSYYTLLGSIADDGHSRIVFDARGFFKPSYFIEKNLGQKIEKAWKSNFLMKLRAANYLPLKCTSCFYKQWCQGGSRFWAKQAHNNYFSADPLIQF